MLNKLSNKMFLLSLVVNDESEHDELTSYIHAFNKHVKGDERVDMSLLAIADGIFLFYVK